MHANNPNEDHNTEDQTTMCKVHYRRLHCSFTQHGSERQFENSVSTSFQPAQLLFQVCSSSPNYSGRSSFIKSFMQPIFNCRNSNKEQEVAQGSWSKLLWNMKKTPHLFTHYQYFPNSNINNELGNNSYSGRSLIYPTGVPSREAGPGTGCVKFLWLLPAKHCTFPSTK